MQVIQYIEQHTKLGSLRIEKALQLFSEDATIPFIARYRKEFTQQLDEIDLEQIRKAQEDYLALEKRRESILNRLEADEVLTADLKKKIKEAQDLTRLEDLYLPYKKKRKTKADEAKVLGLEPLAKQIMAQRRTDLRDLSMSYCSSRVKTSQDALTGAGYIIAEWIAERIDLRNYLRFQLQEFSFLKARVISSKKEEENAQKYKDYFDWEERLKNLPSHRFLAISRAEQAGVIRIKLVIDEQALLAKFESKVIKTQGEIAIYLKDVIKDAYKRLMYPSLSKEIFQEAKQKADATAISVFAKNLKQLLLGAPLGQKRVLALDPGFRTGCKLVCIDEQGDLMHNETIFPHPPQKQHKESIKKISTLCEAYKIEAIAIGDGTASRETEALVKRIQFKHPIEVFVVSEAGASIYSASSIAREEFPNYDITVRGAISIGRRLQDPLAELVKIDPKSIGVGQYQHDVNQIELQRSLDRVVEHCVNTVGVNLNSASKSLLQHVSGIGEKLAENIVAFRQEHGAFAKRADLKKVPRLGAKVYQQAAGFLRVKQSENPLDDSAVHPEQYDLVKKIAQEEGVKVIDLIGNEALLNSIDLERYCTTKFGLPTLEDIREEMKKPGRDIREKAKAFSFNQNIKTIADLEVGMRLPGIVNNITNFGCFVSIGIKESGLIHVSNLADEFVRDVNEYVHLHEQILVKVLEIDLPRKRIQLKKIKLNEK